MSDISKEDEIHNNNIFLNIKRYQEEDKENTNEEIEEEEDEDYTISSKEKENINSDIEEEKDNSKTIEFKQKKRYLNEINRFFRQKKIFAIIKKRSIGLFILFYPI